jgi:predicted esterase
LFVFFVCFFAVPIMSQSIVLPAKASHTATLVFLHGLGDVGESWADVLKDFQVALPHVKIICPTGPTQPVSINSGHRMTSWHDIKSLQQIDDEGKEQFSGIEESVAIVQSIVDSEISSGIAPDKIVVGGFSQGAALTVRTVFSGTRKLAGAVALSGYLVQKTHLLDTLKANEETRKTPLFVGHGTADAVVAFEAGRRLHAALADAGVRAELHTYERMGHSSSERELREVFEFVSNVLSSSNDEHNDNNKS